MRKIKPLFLVLLITPILILSGCSDENPTPPEVPSTAKPVVYLYPEKKTDVNVQLEYKGELTFTYPDYKNGWEVVAKPDGTLINKLDGKEYSYLFWEGDDETHWNMDTGFVVKGGDTVDFLREKLEYLGLTPKEYNEFIVYWAPRMENNPYNLIHFAGEEYENLASLEIQPQPDSILRVFMVYKPLDESIFIPPQSLERFERIGFTVIEWGGQEI